ncbi:Fis family transcriptional regulator [Thermosipho ferrireducens]|uniref:Fis family transcriptional regulator n=1 Tax=Thermosipho ferrireducens TaxID=2571116 RepID=A0ABX7S5X5_9BACT|nr:helix-turn-helix domain-containing protein [Thermosipho ferrireducens]QTA37977.1 Fis family transcriptional regulator [Thermosipho ferrireducens]
MIKILIPQALIENLREFLYNHQNVVFDTYKSNIDEKLVEENWDIVFVFKHDVDIKGKIMVSSENELRLAVEMLEWKERYEKIKVKFDLFYFSPELQGPVIRNFLKQVLKAHKDGEKVILKYESGIFIEDYIRFFENHAPELNVKVSRKKGIEIPPARKRKDDIPYIFDKALSSIYAKHKNIPRHIPEDDEYVLISQYNWPGNTKQIVEVAHKYALTGELNLPVENKRFEEIDLPLYISKTVKQLEKKYIKLALRKSKSRKEAGKLLHMNYKTLSYKIKIYGLDEK